ncbi:putative translation initiation factor SUI1 [Desulforapulum autotrophicum HRM2]|uniref:Translation initiation factor SUI1 n=1 Tax=Desulforapulum autotrophicum (strain ATCC 43914 / DSM 3382 / VKM B-1955 / HRM2) TaxID=177437 RepID=C0QL92_DESAH|nr:translation initiation factor [Desulforapulum autotrophicum]ACN14178.1 putative translation initiation factor SUI1 [Desulforapulum autotrophicum HRM2]
MAKQTKNSTLVYSTEIGRVCPACSLPVAECRCRKAGQAIETDGKVRISYVTKGRRGKGVTLITGLALEADELKCLGKRLKQRCGTGGTVKGGTIEIQGDQRVLLTAELKALGKI